MERTHMHPVRPQMNLYSVSKIIFSPIFWPELRVKALRKLPLRRRKSPKMNYFLHQRKACQVHGGTAVYQVFSVKV
jgi:hypothetical protein